MVKKNRKQIGKLGEQLAVQFLSQKEWRILAENWRNRHGELDLVARDGHDLVFLEVRTRRSSAHFGSALESVDVRKQQQVRATARYYLMANGQWDMPVRFDVIGVTLNAADEVVQIEHVEAAF